MLAKTNNQPVVKVPTSQHTQDDTMVTALPSWHNGSSITAACAVQPVIVSQILFDSNNHQVATVPASKAMATAS